MTHSWPVPHRDFEASHESNAAGLIDWLRDVSLPFWADSGVDRRHGGFHESLLWSGAADTSARKRLFVQMRQIYVFSHASVLGWNDGAALALETLDWVVRKAHAPDGRPGWVHKLEPDGAVADFSRDTYDHAFVLLALAWLAKATGDAQVRSLVDTTLEYVDEFLTAPDGALTEGLPARLPRRQNPHMHALESMLALHENLRHPQGLSRAAHLESLLESRFLRPEPKLREYFADDWSLAAEPLGRVVEPGHQCEWAWLLRRRERAIGLAPRDLATHLLADAVAVGGSGSPFVVDETDADGGVLLPSRKLWPQTELAKAWFSEAGIGKAGALQHGLATVAAMRSAYLGTPFPAGWVAQVDANGHPTVDRVPASSLYHIFGTAVEMARVTSQAEPAGDGQSLADREWSLPA